MSLSVAKSLVTSFARTAGAALPTCRIVHGHVAAAVGLGVAYQYGSSHSDVYSILWAVVFGFATLNILGLAARRLEPTKRGMSFGEFLAVLVVVLSVVLLGWEMLSSLHIFPIRMHR